MVLQKSALRRVTNLKFLSNPTCIDAQCNLHEIQNPDSNLSTLNNLDILSNFSSKQNNAESIKNYLNNFDTQDSHLEIENNSKSTLRGLSMGK